MKRKTIITLITGVFILGGGLWYFAAHRGRAQEKTLETRLVKAVLGDIAETVDATGDVAPLNRVEIKPPVSGRIEKILIAEGDRVRAGQIIAWMSSTERAAIIDSATALGPEERQRWEESYKAAPILSPISGNVILSNVVPGQTVDASTVLFALSDQLIVMAQVDEVDISRVHIGMNALVTLDAYPAQKISGKVLAILYEGKNVSNVISYGVKIVPERVPPFFRSQMTANVSLIVNQKENALLIPLQAIQAHPNGDKYVLLSPPEGKPAAADITTGVENGTLAEVTSGLHAGDTVMIRRAPYKVQSSTASSSPLMFGPKNTSKSGKASRGGPP
jgi:membrane fusion protein, macrolide-specific efflux system